MDWVPYPTERVTTRARSLTPCLPAHFLRGTPANCCTALLSPQPAKGIVDYSGPGGQPGAGALESAPSPAQPSPAQAQSVQQEHQWSREARAALETML